MAPGGTTDDGAARPSSEFEIRRAALVGEIGEVSYPFHLILNFWRFWKKQRRGELALWALSSGAAVSVVCVVGDEVFMVLFTYLLLSVSDSSP